MRILLTNDDGWDSPYLVMLGEALMKDHDLVMVAPETQQSGIGQAVTLYRDIEFRPRENQPYPAWSVGGTPSDCVKVAVCELYRDRGFDCLVSGINAGENAGLSALYSGTVAGAREGATWGIPSLAVSIWNHNLARGRFAAAWMADLLRDPPGLPSGDGVFWNVNFPDRDSDGIAGVWVCRMSQAPFRDRYVRKVNGDNLPRWRLDGAKPIDRFLPESDDHALATGHIAVTPLQIDQGSPAEVRRLNSLEGRWPAVVTQTVAKQTP